MKDAEMNLDNNKKHNNNVSFEPAKTSKEEDRRKKEEEKAKSNVERQQQLAELARKKELAKRQREQELMAKKLEKRIEEVEKKQKNNKDKSNIPTVTLKEHKINNKINDKGGETTKESFVQKIIKIFEPDPAKREQLEQKRKEEQRLRLELSNKKEAERVENELEKEQKQQELIKQREIERQEQIKKRLDNINNMNSQIEKSYKEKAEKEQEELRKQEEEIRKQIYSEQDPEKRKELIEKGKKRIEELRRKNEEKKKRLSNINSVNKSRENALLEKEQKRQEALRQREAEREKRIEELKKKKLEKQKLVDEKRKLKEEQFLQREEQIRQREEEKARLKEEKKILSTKSTVAKTAKDIEREKIRAEREEQRKLKEQKRQEERAKRDELRKIRLKEKYEEELKRKKAKEDRDIILITEKREKSKKIAKEKELARKERKEKALLIRKAREEAKQKQRSERKTFEEKLKDWYNNLAFVKDRQNRRELQRQTLLIDFEGDDAVRSEEKIMYKYVAKNNETGKVETGYFAAFSKLDVHSFLISEGFEVYEITPQRNLAKGLAVLSPKFKASELDFFLTQLSTFLKSGITLVEAVKILAKQSKKRTHKSVYKSIIYELTMGENFSEALAKQGDVFPKLLINMVKTSELTGDLPETLDDMANYYRETEKTRKQMISAISYPIVVLVFAIGILIFMLISVVPQFVAIYGDLGTDLPKITLAIINASNFLKANWLAITIIVLLIAIAFIVLFKTIKVFKSIVQTFFMNLPIVGKIIIYNEINMFTRTFASLLNHNVYITDSMEVLSKITNNEIYKMLIFDTITNLAKGEPVSKSFKNHWAFPTIAYEMILTGEKTGQLGLMMEKVADYYQEQHKNAVGQIKIFIEPIMIILIAAIVGVILLSVVIPMFDMYESLSMQGL